MEMSIMVLCSREHRFNLNIPFPLKHLREIRLNEYDEVDGV